MDNVSSNDFVRQLLDASPGLHALARRVAPPGSDPVDLVQDTLERAWRSQATLQTPAALRGWLRRILINRARDLQARGALIDTVQITGALSDEAASDAAQLILAAEQHAELRAALRGAPPQEVLAVVLHDGEDWPTSEIAGLCGTTTAAMHKRLQRGRRHIARAMQQPAPPARGKPGALCESVYELTARRIRGELGASQQAAVDAHLAGCDHCPPAVRAVQTAVGALRDSKRPLTHEQRARLLTAAAQAPDAPS